jgi:hypothetical protein
MIPKEAIRIKKTNDKKIGPSEDSVNECTELITPDRVKNVPKMQSANVNIIKTIFQSRNISFFS